MRISYGKNVYGTEEINSVVKTLKKSTQMGINVNDFEKKIADIFAKKYGLMVNSGSSALILALKVLNLPQKSEVITPCLNFGTALSSIVLTGLKPILVDCEKDTLQIDISQIKKKLQRILKLY